MHFDHNDEQGGFSGVLGYGLWDGVPDCGIFARERQPPGNPLSFGSKRKLAKKTAAVSTQRTRDQGAARPLDSQRGGRRGRGLNESSITFRS